MCISAVFCICLMFVNIDNYFTRDKVTYILVVSAVGI